MTVHDVRGTHGSGKSYIMYELSSGPGWEPIIGIGQATPNGPSKERHIGHEHKEKGLAIVGAYGIHKSKYSGGCDLLFPEEVVRRVKLFHGQYRHVLLEGILVAHTFARYNQVSLDLEDDYKFCFLNTPLAKCIVRVRTRRHESVGNTTREFGLESVKKDFAQIWERTRAKLKQAGREVVIIDYRDPMSQIVELLEA